MPAQPPTPELKAFVLEFSAKNFFFDRAAVTKGIAKGTLIALRKAGGLVRKIARNSIRRRKKPSLPGNPPHAHTKSNELGIKSIFFALLPDQLATVVGPVKFPNASFSQQLNYRKTFWSTQGGLTVPETLEKGGNVLRSQTWYKHHQSSIRQPVKRQSKAQRRAFIRLFRQGRITHGLQIQQVTKDRHIDKRPFMVPAMKKAAPNIPKCFSQTLGGV